MLCGASEYADMVDPADSDAFSSSLARRFRV